MVDATVIIAAWRAQPHLARAVRSALSQTGIDLEVIVVDDASPDGTFALAQDLAASDARLRVLRLDTNAGPAAARNAGLLEARGRWIAVLDSDDAMQPDRLCRMVRFGDERGADALYDDFQPLDEAERAVAGTHLAPLGLSRPMEWSLEDFLAGCQAEPGRPSLGYLKPVVRRDFLQRHGIVYDESLRNGEDFHLMAELLMAGATLFIMPFAGYLYTLRDGSISRRLDPDHARALAAADAAFLARHFKALSPRAGALMRRRQVRLSDLGTAEAVLQAVKSGHAIRAAGTLLARPRAFGRLCRQAWSALGGRVAGSRQR